MENWGTLAFFFWPSKVTILVRMWRHSLPFDSSTNLNLSQYKSEGQNEKSICDSSDGKHFPLVNKKSLLGHNHEMVWRSGLLFPKREIRSRKESQAPSKTNVQQGIQWKLSQVFYAHCAERCGLKTSDSSTSEDLLLSAQVADLSCWLCVLVLVAFPELCCMLLLALMF